jgi:hypothetical protein
MITDALWTDFSGDGLADLVLVGEWMQIRLFLNTGASLNDITGQEWMEGSKGWWRSICPGDFDQDGDMDYLIGNMGLNFQIKPTMKEPASIYARDFDENGSLDAVMCYYINGKNYPMYPRDDLQSQLPDMNIQYPNYRSYANQTISDVFPGKKLDNALLLQANNFASSYLENIGNNQFEFSPLPFPAQLSPIISMLSEDFDRDGHLDVLLAGNFYGSRIPFGRLDANKGLLLRGDGKGKFEEVPNARSGLFIHGEVRDIARVKGADGYDLVLFSRNNDSLSVYQLSHP